MTETTENERKWTPGPWEASGDGAEIWSAALGSQKYCVELARVVGPHDLSSFFDEEESQANAARIVECVNTCEPFDDPAAAIAGLVTALEMMLDHADETYPHFESPRGQRTRDAARKALATIRR